MNNKGIIDKLKEMGYKKKDSHKFIKDFTNALIETVQEGEQVSLVGFGKFTPVLYEKKKMMVAGELTVVRDFLKVKFTQSDNIAREHRKNPDKYKSGKLKSLMSRINKK